MVRASVMDKIQPQGGNTDSGNAPASDQAAPAEDAAPVPATGAQQPSN